MRFHVNKDNLIESIRYINGPGIYAFRDFNDGRVLYVGKSINIGNRLLNHRPFIGHLLRKHSVLTIEIHHIFDENEIERLEGESIMKYRPPYNIVLNRGTGAFYTELSFLFPKFLHKKMKKLADEKFDSDVVDAYIASSEFFLRKNRRVKAVSHN